ncbi:MAG: twin-arginine translocase TatA/TatE family subunit [Alphaproteobacteria bacterium]|nr:twin-arginine translocase TatA/TatE family subunit [Alphaproteobacteria bacterium]
MRMGWMEIALIVVLVIVLFGHAKIPGMMKNLANGLNVFKQEIKADKKTEKQSQKKAVAKKRISKKK